MHNILKHNEDAALEHTLKECGITKEKMKRRRHWLYGNKAETECAKRVKWTNKTEEKL